MKKKTINKIRAQSGHSGSSPTSKDSRNCLLLQPLLDTNAAQMASLQAALKRAIETVYQLEDNELAAEPLPDSDNRQQLLFYEASEGGGWCTESSGRGFERRCNKLRAQHSNSATLMLRASISGKRRAQAKDCEAACYDCLLSYGNQREHDILDRKTIDNWLLRLSRAEVIAGTGYDSRDDHLAKLLQQCDSELERKWLQSLSIAGLRLPDAAQTHVEACRTRPDFVYSGGDGIAAIYIDGSHHDYPDRQTRDRGSDGMHGRSWLHGHPLWLSRRLGRNFQRLQLHLRG